LLRINNFNDVAATTLDEWIYFLKNEEIKDNFKAKGIQKAKKAFSLLSMPEKDRLAYSRYQDDLRYQASLVESNYGLGRLDGREAGIEEGIEQRNTEIALEMIKDGESYDKIRKYTGLTDEEIERLRIEKK
jgi:predicted transposase/invertase (TIGR01784 family)